MVIFQIYFVDFKNSIMQNFFEKSNNSYIQLCGHHNCHEVNLSTDQKH